MLNKNTKVMVWRPNGNTNIFKIVAGVSQGNILAPFSLKIYLDYKLRASIDIKTRSRWYSAETITNADYAEDLALHVNTHAQAESLLRSLEQAVWSIGLFVD